MRLQRTDVAALAIFAALTSSTALAEMHTAALITSDASATQSESVVAEDLAKLPPSAAGPDEKVEIPLHFVPLTVQAFQDMDKETEDGKKVPTANMLPFTF